MSVAREEIASAIPCLGVSLGAGHPGALVGLSALSPWETTLDGFWQGTYNTDTAVLLLGALAQSWAPSAVPGQKRQGALVLVSQMESACVTIHEMLNAVIDSQTHYRLREAQDRSRAEELNGRVSYWSVGETLILFMVSIGQVMLLKSFFTEKRPSSSGAGT